MSPSAVSVPLPAVGYLVDLLTSNGQTFVRGVQRELVPRIIAGLGYRWHNKVSRDDMIQVMRAIAMGRGGLFVHWDALDARSPKSSNAHQLGCKVAQSHAHAAKNHRDYVAGGVSALFQATPNDPALVWVKNEVFGIADGGPIIPPDHPVIQEMVAQPIVGAP